MKLESLEDVLDGVKEINASYHKLQMIVEYDESKLTDEQIIAAAKKKGYTPSQAHLTLLAWNLFITSVPQTIWKTETVIKVYPVRWQIEIIFKSWKSYLHLASIKTTKEDTTLCDLSGRMLLILLNDALCPQMRATVWLKKKWELSVVKLVRHFQAREQAQQRGLAAARRTEEADELALGDVEVDARQRGEGAEVLADTGQPQIGRLQDQRFSDLLL